MITRPTAVQATAIRTAIDNNRLLDLGDYATQTVAIMRRNEWIDLEPNGSTARITPEAARSIGMFTVADRYEREDSPETARQEQVIEALRRIGVDADVPTGRTRQVLVDVEQLAAILAHLDSGVLV